MKSITEFVTSFDVFGEPVTINYKNDATFKTCLGAVATIGLKIFVLVFAATQFLALTQFKDPVITQYVVYEPRNDDTEVSLSQDN